MDLLEREVVVEWAEVGLVDGGGLSGEDDYLGVSVEPLETADWT